MKLEIKELTQEKGKEKKITLRTFFNVVHTCAVFDFHEKSFKKYVVHVLSIIMGQDHPIDHRVFFKLMWSLCVLYERYELKPLYPFI